MTVTREGPSDLEAIFGWEVTNIDESTAFKGNDFSIGDIEKTMYFEAGNVSKTIPITIVNVCRHMTPPLSRVTQCPD